MKTLGVSSISSINTRVLNNPNITFCGKYKDCFGNVYTDKRSQESELKHLNDGTLAYQDSSMPNIDIIQKFTRATVGKPVTDKALIDMNINSLKTIGNKCLKGGLTGAAEYVEQLKDYGIKNFVILCNPHETNILQECEKHNVPSTIIYIPIEDLKSPNEIQYFSNRVNPDSFVEAVLKLREGNCFVGCESGNIRTKRFLSIVQTLDPQCKLELSGLETQTSDLNCAEIIFKKLKPEHKEILGYTKEFEAGILEQFALLSKFIKI